MLCSRLASQRLHQLTAGIGQLKLGAAVKPNKCRPFYGSGHSRRLAAAANTLMAGIKCPGREMKWKPPVWFGFGWNEIFMSAAAAAYPPPPQPAWSGLKACKLSFQYLSAFCLGMHLCGDVKMLSVFTLNAIPILNWRWREGVAVSFVHISI